MIEEYDGYSVCPQCGSRDIGLTGIEDLNTFVIHRVCRGCGMRWDSGFPGFSSGIMDDLEALDISFSDEELGMFLLASSRIDIRFRQDSSKNFQ